MIGSIVFIVGLIIAIIFNIYNYIQYIISGKFMPTDIEYYDFMDWLMVFICFFMVILVSWFWPIELLFIGFKRLVIFWRKNLGDER